MTSECKLCGGSGENRTRERMKVNNHICPRCGGYGRVPKNSVNPPFLTEEDYGYMLKNGWQPRKNA